MNEDYNLAIDMMAQQMLEDFDLEARDSYLHGMTLDIDNRDLMLFIDLVEGQKLNPTSTSVKECLTEYRSENPHFTYRPIIEDQIEVVWKHTLDPLPRLAVKYAIERAAITDADALMGGGYEAEQAFIQSTCNAICDYLRKQSENGSPTVKS